MYHGARGVPRPWGVPWPSRGVPWPLYEEYGLESAYYLYYCVSSPETADHSEVVTPTGLTAESAQLSRLTNWRPITQSTNVQLKSPNSRTANIQLTEKNSRFDNVSG